MGRDHSIECERCGTSYGGFNGPDECECVTTTMAISNAIAEEVYEADPNRVLELASQPGGVSVVRADGSVRMHISIPCTDWVCDNDECVETRVRLVDLTARADALLTCLRRLHDQLVRVGGYATHADQAELLEARVLLGGHGK